jgi:hypothetical protein
MRRFVSLSVALLVAGSLQSALAQGFAGTFVSPEAALSVTIQQGADGSLSGTLSSSTGHFGLQGQASGTGAYGVVDSGQGQLGFQAALSVDGSSVTFQFFQMGPNGQPAPAGQPVVLVRSGGAGPTPGGLPSQAPGAMPGQAGGGFPGQAGGGFPAQQAPGQVPGQVPAHPVPAGDWNGTFVGNAGALVLAVQGAQGAYYGYLQAQGQQFQFEAHLDELTLHGAFVAGGQQYEFWVERDGPYAILWLGPEVYMLEPATMPAGQ